jgi:predicted unusual protein kinase regulating ubiquinone biosynthesis (AarF/ABC1/UbiB family)
MVGELDLRKRISFATFLLAFRDRDVSVMATTLRSLSKPFRRPDDNAFRKQFEQRIGPLIDPNTGQTAPLQKLVSEAMDVLRSAGYRLDSELTLAVKAVAQAEAIASAIVPEAEASDFAELGAAALEELVPRAVDKDVILTAARRRAILAAGEVAQRLPEVQEGASAWLDQLIKGELSAKVRVADLEPTLARLEAVPRVLAAAIVLTGLVIGSAIAAAIDTGESRFRTSLTDAALVVYVAATAVGVLLVFALLWRVVRPQGRRRRRRSGLD